MKCVIANKHAVMYQNTAMSDDTAVTRDSTFSKGSEYGYLSQTVWAPSTR